MTNAFSRTGRTCARFALAGGVLAASLFAAPHEVTVNIPHAVTVGSVTLPEGECTITDLNMNTGDEYFLVRSADGHVTTIQAQRIDSAGPSKSQVVFSKDGDTWRFDRMFVQGESTGFLFVNAK